MSNSGVTLTDIPESRVFDTKPPSDIALAAFRCRVLV
jgi:hypothetical protein